MKKMPRINVHHLDIDEDVTAEQRAILKIIIKADSTLRATKPPLAKMSKIKDASNPYGYTYAWATDSERLQAKAAYVWRMVAFAISPKPAHHCMPILAFCNLDGTSDERRAMEKELNAFADRIVKCVPVREQHGTMRWAQAYGLAGTPQYNEEGAVVYR